MIWFTDAHCTLLHHHIAPSPMSDMIICCFYGTHSAWHTKPGSQSLRNKKNRATHLHSALYPHWVQELLHIQIQSSRPLPTEGDFGRRDQRRAGHAGQWTCSFMAAASLVVNDTSRVIDAFPFLSCFLPLFLAFCFPCRLFASPLRGHQVLTGTSNSITRDTNMCQTHVNG